MKHEIPGRQRFGEADTTYKRVEITIETEWMTTIRRNGHSSLLCEQCGHALDVVEGESLTAIGQPRLSDGAAALAGVAAKVDVEEKLTWRRRMKNLKTRLRVINLLSLILLAWTAAAYGQLTPTGDAYTNTADPATNYGAKTLLDVESSQTTYIQFNLSSIPAGYTGATITKATLKLYANTVATAGSFNVDYINGTWTETTIDASNAPALGTTIAASVPLVTADKNQYILIDVTTAVQAWLNGTEPNDGIALVANSPLNANFDSKESATTSHAPELDIVFASGGTLTGVTTASGSGLIGAARAAHSTCR